MYHVFVLTPGKLIRSVETPFGMVVTVAVMDADEESATGSADVGVPVRSVADPAVWPWSSTEGVGSKSAVINDFGAATVIFDTALSVN